MDQKGQNLAKNDQYCIFQAKFGFGKGAKVLVLTYQNTNLAPRSHCFLVGHSITMDQKGRYLAQNDQKCQLGPKVIFCLETKVFTFGPKAENGPLALLFDFSFLRNARFHKKKKQPTRQKVFPHPTVGAPLEKFKSDSRVIAFSLTC